MKEIFNNIINSINFGEIITTAIVIAIIYIINKVKPYAISLSQNLVQYVDEKYKGTKYENIMKTAKDIWYKVEEDYRIEESVSQKYLQKRDYFDALLLKTFPTLTQKEIDLIRQAISGKENISKINNTIVELDELIGKKEDGSK